MNANANVLQIILQLGLEIAGAVAKAREAARAEGVELDALLTEAARENGRSIYEVLGIPPPPSGTPI